MGSGYRHCIALFWAVWGGSRGSLGGGVASDLSSICRLIFKFEWLSVHSVIYYLFLAVRNAIDDSIFWGQVIGPEQHFFGSIWGRFSQKRQEKEKKSKRDKKWLFIGGFGTFTTFCRSRGFLSIFMDFRQKTRERARG